MAPRLAVKSQNLIFWKFANPPSLLYTPPTMTHTTHGITHHAKRSLETGKFGRHRFPVNGSGKQRNGDFWRQNGRERWNFECLQACRPSEPIVCTSNMMFLTSHRIQNTSNEALGVSNKFAFKLTKMLLKGFWKILIPLRDNGTFRFCSLCDSRKTPKSVDFGLFFYFACFQASFDMFCMR